MSSFKATFLTSLLTIGIAQLSYLPHLIASTTPTPASNSPECTTDEADTEGRILIIDGGHEELSPADKNLLADLADQDERKALAEVTGFWPHELSTERALLSIKLTHSDTFSNYESLKRFVTKHFVTDNVLMNVISGSGKREIVEQYTSYFNSQNVLHPDFFPSLFEKRKLFTWAIRPNSPREVLFVQGYETVRGVTRTFILALKYSKTSVNCIDMTESSKDPLIQPLNIDYPAANQFLPPIHQDPIVEPVFEDFFGPRVLTSTVYSLNLQATPESAKTPVILPRTVPLVRFLAQNWENHPGIDIALPVGTPVYSVAYGKVALLGYHPAAGKYLVIEHLVRKLESPGQFFRVYSVYLHLDSFEKSIELGALVQADQKIAETGNSGSTIEAHLHFATFVPRLPDGHLLLQGQSSAQRWKSFVSQTQAVNPIDYIGPFQKACQARKKSEIENAAKVEKIFSNKVEVGPLTAGYCDKTFENYLSGAVPDEKMPLLYKKSGQSISSILMFLTSPN